MKLKKLIFALGLGVGIAVTAAPGYAAIERWNFQDDNIEFILTPDATKAHPDFGAVNLGGTDYWIKDYTVNNPVESGDLFIAVFEFPDADRLTYPGLGLLGSLIPPGQELTGIMVAEATTIATGLSFQPFSAGLNAVIAAGGGNVIDAADDPSYSGYADAGGGALLAAWLNPTADFDLDLNASTNPATNCASLTDCISKAATGNLFQVDGFTGDEDEEWTYIGETNIKQVKDTADSTAVGVYNFWLGNFYNIRYPVLLQNKYSGVPAPTCGNPGDVDDCVQVVGSGNILGGRSLENGAVGHSDIDAQKYVPEPATLALFGIGLLGLGRRMKRA